MKKVHGAGDFWHHRLVFEFAHQCAIVTPQVDGIFRLQAAKTNPTKAVISYHRHSLFVFLPSLSLEHIAHRFQKWFGQARTSGWLW